MIKQIKAKWARYDEYKKIAHKSNEVVQSFCLEQNIKFDDLKGFYNKYKNLEDFFCALSFFPVLAFFCLCIMCPLHSLLNFFPNNYVAFGFIILICLGVFFSVLEWTSWHWDNTLNRKSKFKFGVLGTLLTITLLAIMFPDVFIALLRGLKHV